MAPEHSEQQAPAAEHQATAYGCRWESDFPLTAFHPSSFLPSPANIQVRHASSSFHVRALRQRSSRIWLAMDGLRYVSETRLAFDTFGGRRVEVHAASNDAAGSSSELPLPFYGTVTAALLAWRALIPLHGTAVEWGGKAILICGPSGAGKSTFAAALLCRGARLISDDLSVVHAEKPGGPLAIFAGRRTLRLFPATAGFASQYIVWTDAPKPAGNKLAVAPPCVDPLTPFPLSTVVLLDHPSGGLAIDESASQKAELLQKQMFRPALMRSVPGHPLRLATLTFAAPQLSIAGRQKVDVWSRQDFDRLADESIAGLGNFNL